MDEHQIIKEGSILRCPACRSDMYKIIRDLRYGDLLMQSCFKGINGFLDPVDDEKFNCPHCGASLSVMLCLYAVSPEQLENEEAEILELSKIHNKFWKMLL